MLCSLLFFSLIRNAHLGNGGKDLCQTPLNGTTSQSSNYVNENKVLYTSERALDGAKNVCAHTTEQENNWWTIDLLGVYKISSISIFNKDHQYADISGTQIHIGNSPQKNGTTNRIYRNITDFTIDHWNDIVFNSTVSGRYITASLPKKTFLVLCEVKICGEKKESPFKLIKTEKTWEDALYHCRDRNMDLASILDEEDQAWAELEAKDADTPFVWLGLHYTCALEFWFWVEDHPLQFSRWAPNNKTEGCDTSVAMQTKEDHLWFSMSDYKKLNFICIK